MKINEIYLDNSATTRVSATVAKKMNEVLLNDFGNPSSLHAKGFEAEKIVNKTKKTLAMCFGCQEEEIYFTSGGTEANNLSIFGTAKAKNRAGNKIVTTAIEHESVLACCQELEKKGFEVVYLKPDLGGNIKPEQFESSIDENTILVSSMMVNNEIGSVLPIKTIKSIIKQKKSPALFHIDAVQAFGKISVKAHFLGADLITISSHKLHGPKGVGALFCSKNAKIKPILFGGEQQKRLRPGTLPTQLIAGFGVAASQAEQNLNKNFEKVKNLNEKFKKELLKIEKIELNQTDFSFPYILNFSVLGLKSETLLNYLSSNNIYISSGSACSHGKVSHVLKAMNLPDERIQSSLRISFSKYNNTEQLEQFVTALKSAIFSLCKA